MAGSAIAPGRLELIGFDRDTAGPILFGSEVVFGMRTPANLLGLCDFDFNRLFFAIVCP
jgi:hypothetical protein